MDRLEKMACRVSESLIFGGFMDKTYESLKKRNFNCRWGKKIVDVCQIDSLLFGAAISLIFRILDLLFSEKGDCLKVVLTKEQNRKSLLLKK